MKKAHLQSWFGRYVIALSILASFHAGAGQAQALNPPSLPMGATPAAAAVPQPTAATQARDQEAIRRRNLARRRRAQENLDRMAEHAMLAAYTPQVAAATTPRRSHRVDSTHRDVTAGGRPAAPRPSLAPVAPGPLGP